MVSSKLETYEFVMFIAARIGFFTGYKGSLFVFGNRTLDQKNAIGMYSKVYFYSLFVNNNKNAA